MYKATKYRSGSRIQWDQYTATCTSTTWDQTQDDVCIPPSVKWNGGEVKPHYSKLPLKVVSHQRDCMGYLHPCLQFGTSKHKSTEYTPFEMMYQRLAIGWISCYGFLSLSIIIYFVCADRHGMQSGEADDFEGCDFEGISATMSFDGKD